MSALFFSFALGLLHVADIMVTFKGFIKAYVLLEPLNHDHVVFCSRRPSITTHRVLSSFNRDGNFGQKWPAMLSSDLH